MYNDRRSVEIGCLRPSTRTHSCGVASIWTAGGVAIVLLVAAGIAYRMGSTRMERPSLISLPVPLSEVPIHIKGWVGETLEIPSVTQEYMRANFADDYISRRYVNEQQRMWADAYVVYCSSRPAGMLGHQPMVCFPGHGWIHDGTSESEYETDAGRRMKCLVHRFHKPAPDFRRVVVMSFYVLNGEITLREKDFSGFFGRRPNISGNPARYVAQIQISSMVENSARSLAAVLTDPILAILPDPNGQVDWPVPPQDSSEPDGTAQGSN